VLAVAADGQLSEGKAHGVLGPTASTDVLAGALCVKLAVSVIRQSKQHQAHLMTH
jgi:hypothetical protein